MTGNSTPQPSRQPDTTRRTSCLDRFKAETENLIWKATLDGSPLQRMHRLLELRFERTFAAVAVKTRTAISDDPLDCEGALRHLTERIQIALRREFEWIAVNRGPEALADAQRAVDGIGVYLDAFDRSSCGRVLGRRSGPSWLELREACTNELSMFRLWAVSVDGAATRRAASAPGPGILLTPTERRIMDALGPIGKSSQMLSEECGLSSADTVRGHIRRMKGKGVRIMRNGSSGYVLETIAS